MNTLAMILMLINTNPKEACNKIYKNQIEGASYLIEKIDTNIGGMDRLSVLVIGEMGRPVRLTSFRCPPFDGKSAVAIE